jgi:hypothetical protein
MNFLQKIITRNLLKGMEKMAQKDPAVRSSFDALAKASYQLQKDIDAHIKNSKDTFK